MDEMEYQQHMEVEEEVENPRPRRSRKRIKYLVIPSEEEEEEQLLEQPVSSEMSEVEYELGKEEEQTVNQETEIDHSVE